MNPYIVSALVGPLRTNQVIGLPPVLIIAKSVCVCFFTHKSGSQITASQPEYTASIIGVRCGRFARQFGPAPLDGRN